MQKGKTNRKKGTANSNCNFNSNSNCNSKLFLQSAHTRCAHASPFKHHQVFSFNLREMLSANGRVEKERGEKTVCVCVCVVSRTLRGKMMKMCEGIENRLGSK